MRNFSSAVFLGAVVALLAGGCSSWSNARKIDYRNTPTRPPLEVPPDLTALPEPSLPAPRPSATTNADAAASPRASAPNPTVLPAYPNVRLVREGQARYVVVQAEPSAVWEPVREFLTQNGFAIAAENPRAGLIETEWTEKRPVVGASNKKSLLGRWFTSLHSTGLRDKFRVRLERGVAPGTTEIYLSHQGMEQVELDDEGPGKNQAGWKPRPRDGELEAEMLQRLVVHLGGERAPPTQSAQAEPAPAPAPASEQPNARLTRNGDGTVLLTLEDSLDRAWRRVGLSLDRMGFTVEDRDRAKGIYYVRYIDPDAQRGKKGFFSRLFSGDDPEPPTQFQVHLKPAENGTNVEVLDKTGDPATSAKTGERILSLLYEQLK